MVGGPPTRRTGDRALGQHTWRRFRPCTGVGAGGYGCVRQESEPFKEPGGGEGRESTGAHQWELLLI